MSEIPSERFELLRQLAARYWRPLVSLVAGIPAALNGLQKALRLENGILLPDFASTTMALYWLIGFGLFIFVIVRFPRIAVSVTQLLLGSPKLPSDLKRIFRGPRPYYSNDVLPGRQREIDDCWMHIQREEFFILEGESGCGKTSILNAALLPKAEQKFRVISCRIAEDPFDKLHSALLQEGYRKSKQAVGANVLAKTITKAAQLNSGNAPHSPESVKPLLLSIDQFEELFVTVKSEIRSRFLATLKEALKDGKLRLILVIRNDFRDLLYEICRAVDPHQEALNLGNYYTLQAFSEDQAEAVLGYILEPVHRNEPLIKQQLDDFRKALVSDLLRPPRDPRLFQGEEGTVLPIELQTVGMMIESIGIKHFSVAGLKRLGGKRGLFRAYIEGAKDYAWRKTGVNRNQTMLILRQLISPAQTKWAQAAQSIGENLRIPSDQVERVLDAFAEKYLVNPLPVEEEGNNLSKVTFSKQYELMHEHLVQILSEAPDPTLQRARDAQERLIFWVSRTKNVFESVGGGKPRSFFARLGSFLAQPIPLMEGLRLWRFSRNNEERRMLRRNLRGFCLRAVPLALLLMIGIFAASLWYQDLMQRVMEEWRVSGKIDLPAELLNSVRVSIPHLTRADISPNGNFRLIIPVRRDRSGTMTLPPLFIEVPGYRSVMMHLRVPPNDEASINREIIISNREIIIREPIRPPIAKKPQAFDWNKPISEYDFMKPTSEYGGPPKQ